MEATKSHFFNSENSKLVLELEHSTIAAIGNMEMFYMNASQQIIKDMIPSFQANAANGLGFCVRDFPVEPLDPANPIEPGMIQSYLAEYPIDFAKIIDFMYSLGQKGNIDLVDVYSKKINENGYNNYLENPTDITRFNLFINQLYFAFMDMNFADVRIQWTIDDTIRVHAVWLEDDIWNDDEEEKLPSYFKNTEDDEDKDLDDEEDEDDDEEYDCCSDCTHCGCHDSES